MMAGWLVPCVCFFVGMSSLGYMIFQFGTSLLPSLDIGQTASKQAYHRQASSSAST